ncbi:MAG: arginase [Myxococcales bacterium]|nr:arginase [Myxococcales bacterium]USN50161.1 MAG: arginase [Myxococcales bacterium]
MLYQKKVIDIFGVPFDIGGGATSGTSMGPATLRTLGLKNKIQTLGYETIDRGDIPSNSQKNLEQQADKLSAISEICSSLMTLTMQSLDMEHTPLIIGGDHSLAIGSINGVNAHLGKYNKKLGIIWIDAHGDSNTPQSSLTKNIHGMPLAAIMGHGYNELIQFNNNTSPIDPKNISLIGIRNLDPQERDFIKNSGINYFSMKDIDEKGIAYVIDQAIDQLSHKVDATHLSFDLDALDPLYAPGVSVPEAGGLSFREARLILECAYQSKKIISMEFVELNPLFDTKNTTANLCIDLIQSALGKSII